MSEGSLPEAIFRDASDPMVVLNSDRTVRTANPAFRALVRRGRDGTDFMDLVSEHARNIVSRQLVRAAAGGEILIEVPHPGPKGEDHIVEYGFFPMDGGMVAGVGRVREREQALGEELGRTKAELQQKGRLLDEIQMELTQVPFTDPVTGVWNRLQVIERLTAEWSRSERSSSPVGCLMVDVEGLHDVRLTQGESVADEMLKAVARRIKSVARDHDIVGRYGGDQFVVIAVNSDAEGARSFSERILECVRREPIAVAGRSVEVTVRIGACTNRAESVEIMEDLFSAAETALADARAQAVDLCLSDEPGV
ncbi:MAG: sensor domain-containing diguanylate cyclase [Planctomycetota bacterium]|jgi:diguanylate cyclase (GGDEF)-like protein